MRALLGTAGFAADRVIVVVEELVDNWKKS